MLPPELRDDAQAVRLRSYRLPAEVDPAQCEPFDGLALHWLEGRGLGYAAPLPAPDALGRFYAERYRAVMGKQQSFAHYLGSPNYRAQTRSQVDWVAAAAAGPSGRWLDVGAGFGLLLWTAAQRLEGWSFFGLEPDRAAHAHLASLVAFETDFDAFWRGELFTAGHFDVITLSHVLEHLGDPWAALRALGRYLRPGGVLMVEVPHDDRRALMDPARHSDMPHLWFFSEPGLQCMAQEAGFRVERSAVLGLLPPGRRAPLPIRIRRHIARQLQGPLALLDDRQWYAEGPDRTDLRLICRKN